MRVAAFACLTLAAACAPSTPDLVLREETDASTQVLGLCDRMAQDFDMRVVAGDVIAGRTFEANFIDRLIAGRGLSFVFDVKDEDPAENCYAAGEGVSCGVNGPALFSVQSAAGRATYRVRAGERAQVESQGSRLRCREAS